METFLRACKESLAKINHFDRINVVLGNEACDLDSAVSALVTAYFLYQLHPSNDKVVIPVLNVRRKDLKIHTEVTFFLEETSLPLELVICKDEIDLKKLHADKKLSLTLVDHNLLSTEDGAFESSVVEVIDHHKQECIDRGSRCKSVIENVGSCCTLVAEKIFSADPSIIDPQIAMLLYGTILLDTVCLADSAHRVTPKDKDIAGKLESFLEGISKEEVFQTLQKAKSDVSGLTLDELLRKDLKVVSNGTVSIAVCSVPLLLEGLLKKGGVDSSLQQFCSDNKFQGVVLIGANLAEKTKVVHRQLAIYSIFPPLRQQVAYFLLSVKEPSAQLEQIELGISSLLAFHQGNSALTRKFFLPLLQSFLSDSNNTSGIHFGKAHVIPPNVPALSIAESSHLTGNTDDMYDFDPLGVDGNDSNLGSPRSTAPSITGHLGIMGEPLSSQGSSTQNSCPYTPQNSFVDDSFDLDSTMLKQSNILPSFNSKEMIEKIEHKRGKLGGCEADVTGIKTLPFTPKNSFVDSNFDSYQSQEILSIDSDVLLERVRKKKASLAGIEEQRNSLDSLASEKIISTNRSSSTEKSLSGEGTPNGITFVAKSFEGINDDCNVQQNNTNFHISLNENSSNHVLSATNSDPLDSGCADVSSGEPSFETAKSPLSPFRESGDVEKANNAVNSTGPEQQRKMNNYTKSYSQDRKMSTSDQIDIDPEVAANYQAETVDFPDSPKHTKLLKEKSAGSQDQEEDKSMIQSPTSEGPPSRRERPSSLSTGRRRRKIAVNPDILSSDVHDDDQKSLSSLSNKSDADIFSPVDDLVTPDDIDTPDELDDSVLERVGSSDPIPEFSAAEEYEEERSWRTCVVGGVERKIDMKVIEPYKKVLSHGGYYGPNRHAIIVFSACYLPDRSRRDYDYVMDNLFLYVLTTLDQLVAEDYILVYLHGATQRSNMPSFGWLKRCYQMIDRRLRKNLKGLYLVHPTFWLKTIVIMTRPFISSKFSRKLQFVNSLQELSDLIPMDHVCIPDKVKQFDEERSLEA